ncbi:lipopolysaccharide biosynthesis protein [Streptomyces sp. NBC_01217]|uniref:lipopolysaccharide biosynthesis protein n=1 Tax=Streptomyces sp. NBC_01217 TaxID=2903779 RepID=UPI002E13DBF7|nr:lipopolysaccharide biosynthesis protein [Streptomyces sp. NBC_01217]
MSGTSSTGVLPDGTGAETDGTSPAKRWGHRRWQGHLSTFCSLTVAGQVEAALSLATTATLVRLVGSTEAGEVLLTQSMASVWFLLWDPRFEDAQQRFVPMEQRRGTGHGTRLYRRLLQLDMAAGLLATVVGVFVALAAAAMGWISAERLSLLVPAVLAAGAATPSGSASAGFAIADQLSRIGVIRLKLAVFGCLVTLTALLTAGTVGYLVATVITGLVSTVALTVVACREVYRACGPATDGPVSMPRGLVPFLVKSSATTSVSLASDSGVSLVAGLLGGPALVTYLKVAAAAGRVFSSFINPVASQLYPRLARSGAHGRREAVMRDVLRCSALTGGIGLVAVAVGACLLSLLVRLVYGPEYTIVSTAAVVMLAGAALRGTVIWSKVLPSALGFPGVRLVFLTAEAVCQLGMLVAVIQICAGASCRTLAWAWGLLGLLSLSTAAWFVVLWYLTRSMSDPNAPTEPGRWASGPPSRWQKAHGRDHGGRPPAQRQGR